MMRATGCDGVVVGRGCLGRPWLFRDLADAFAGARRRRRRRSARSRAVMVEHARLLVDRLGSEPQASRDFRKHTGWYLTGYPVGGEVRRAFANASTGWTSCNRWSTGSTLAVVAGRARSHRRGHTNGPRRVVLPDGYLDDLEATSPGPARPT